MALADTRLSISLALLARVMNVATALNPDFAKRLKEKDICFQIRLSDNSISRHFIVKNGRVRSHAGMSPEARVTLTFDSAKTANKLLSPWRKQLDFIHAARNFQVVPEGNEEDCVERVEIGHQPAHQIGTSETPAEWH